VEQVARPIHDTIPWACVTCGGWVPPFQRIYTDEGLFHDRIACLSTDRFEELVLKYGCKCVDQVSPHVVAVTL
jgi:hypothetical protein